MDGLIKPIEEQEKNLNTKESKQNLVTFNNLSKLNLIEYEKIKNLNLIDQLGKGCFGAVFKISNLLENNNETSFKAIKIIPIINKSLERLLANQTSISIIEDNIWEIKIWKNLNHQNIVKYNYSFINNSNTDNSLQACVVMELVEGLNLTEYINNLKDKKLFLK